MGQVGPQLLEAVKWCIDRHSRLIVPSFAIGRTQEFVYELDRLVEAGRIPHLPLFLDSPMASKATDIYRHHADYFDEETRAVLARTPDLLTLAGSISVPAAKRGTPWAEVLDQTRRSRATGRR